MIQSSMQNFTLTHLYSEIHYQTADMHKIFSPLASIGAQIIRGVGEGNEHTPTFNFCNKEFVIICLVIGCMFSNSNNKQRNKF